MELQSFQSILFVVGDANDIVVILSCGAGYCVALWMLQLYCDRPQSWSVFPNRIVFLAHDGVIKVILKAASKKSFLVNVNTPTIFPHSNCLCINLAVKPFHFILFNATRLIP